MESWNEVIHTALLGTDKRSLDKGSLTETFSESLRLIDQVTQTKEEVFLQTATLLYNYRQCGFQPLAGAGVEIPAAGAEEKSYASTPAHGTLFDVLETGSASLLQFWLQQCAGAGRIVQPEVVPLLLDTGMKHKDIKPLVQSCIGKRGAWLLPFNDAWNYGEETGDEEGWQTGTLEQRKEVLARIRQSDPAKAREWLQQTWADENAATRAELVKVLSIHAGADDLPWLEELLKEKSSKVKDEVLRILKRIPSSSVVQLYWKTLAPAIHLKKEKTRLGLGSKTVLEFGPVPPVDEAIYKTGIEQLSSEKGITDDDFLLYQLIQSVPPSFIERHLGLAKEEILKLLEGTAKGKSFLPALGEAAIRFEEVEWLKAVITRPEARLYEEAFRLLPQADRESYALRQLESGQQAPVIDALTDLDSEWSPELARAVLRVTAKNTYQYNKMFYNSIVHLLPLTIAGELAHFAPKEEYPRALWGTLGEHLGRLLDLKQQTLKAFNS